MIGMIRIAVTAAAAGIIIIREERRIVTLHKRASEIPHQFAHLRLTRHRGGELIQHQNKRAAAIKQRADRCRTRNRIDDERERAEANDALSAILLERVEAERVGERRLGPAENGAGCGGCCCRAQLLLPLPSSSAASRFGSRCAGVAVRRLRIRRHAKVLQEKLVETHCAGVVRRIAENDDVVDDE